MYLPLDHNSPVPLHQQAEEWLRQLIRKEAYQQGHPIPPEVQLAEQLRISRSTLRQAISKLVFEGLLVRKRRWGTCVPERRLTGSLKQPASMQLTEPDTGNYHFELHVSLAAPSDASMLLFNIQRHTKLVRMERLSAPLKSPFEYTVAEFNPALTISVAENFNLPVLDILEKKHGLDIKKIQEALLTVNADLFLAAKLGVVPGTPLLVRKRCIYTGEDVPAVLSADYYKADAFNESAGTGIRTSV